MQWLISGIKKHCVCLVTFLTLSINRVTRSFRYQFPNHHLSYSAAYLSNMLIYIGVIEFICSQSPTSMKGLLIGLVYAIKGLFQLIAALLTIPFYVPWNGKSTFPSCGFYFYMMGLVVSLSRVCVGCQEI